jgi:hypothetical protein
MEDGRSWPAPFGAELKEVVELLGGDGWDRGCDSPSDAVDAVVLLSTAISCFVCCRKSEMCRSDVTADLGRPGLESDAPSTPRRHTQKLVIEQPQKMGRRRVSEICKLMSRPSIRSFAGTVRAGGICGEWPWLWRRLSFPSGDFDFDSEFGVCQRSVCAALLAKPAAPPELT